MTEQTLSPSQVRMMLLAAQGLLTPPDHPATQVDVLDAIRRMGALQIDTIHVIARSPYLVLWSRLGSYDPGWLDQLLAEGALFEYWAHAACFLPIEDYPLYTFRMAEYSKKHYGSDWHAAHRDTIADVIGRIQQEGAVRSADFERKDGRKSGWWDWKVEKRALEYLFTRGDLMIARREKFQRVYDLRQRVLAEWDEAQAVPAEAAKDALTLKAVRALGASLARWVPDYFRLPKRGMPERLERLADEGYLQRVMVEGWEETAYVHPDHLLLLDQATTGNLQATVTTLLSPFDPIVWDRERARAVFNFDFALECYLPQEKRRYGYFSLPILDQGKLIGRLDPKAHRKEGIFEVRSLYLEEGVEVSNALAARLSGAIQRCARWHGTPQVAVTQSDPPGFVDILKQSLSEQTQS